MRQKTKAKGKVIKITLLSLIGFILVFSIGSLILVKYLYDSQFPRVDVPRYSGRLQYSDISGYDRTLVNFKSGKNTLTGYIYGKDNDKGLVVIAHGLGGGAENYLAETMYFVDQGWKVFSYDCTGSYLSEGKSTVGIPQSLKDLDSALKFARGNPDLSDLPVMLYGHSWGGFAVAAVLNYDFDIKAVVSVAGFNTPMELLVEQAKNMLGVFAYIAYPFEWAYQTLLFGHAASASATKGINSSEASVMLIHGTQDQAILYDGSSIIAHKDQIINPNVVYKTFSEENQSGHSDILLSTKAVEYINEKNSLMRALYNMYEGNLPDEVIEDYYANVDTVQTCELNMPLMEEINTFFEENLP